MDDNYQLIMSNYAGRCDRWRAVSSPNCEASRGKVLGHELGELI